MTRPAIRIRPFQPPDAVSAYKAVQESLPQVSQWMADLNPSLTLEDVQAYIAAQPGTRAEGRAYNFAIVEAVSDHFLGGCGLTHINRQHRFANLYYWVRSSRSGQGVATAAVRQLARYGFETLELGRIEIVVAAGNPASIRVAEKAGAVREGLLRDRITVGEVVHDAYLYSLIPADLDH